jgi:hypothetical protein
VSAVCTCIGSRGYTAYAVASGREVPLYLLEQGPLNSAAAQLQNVGLR